MLKNLLLLVSLIMISGCQSLMTNIKKEDLGAIDKIGIVSFVGDKIAYNYVGATIFGNENYFVQVDDWEIDLAIANELEKGINARSDIPTKVIKTRSEWLEPIFDGSDNYAFSIKKQLPMLQKIAADNQVKYLTIVYRTSAQFDKTPTHVQGIGFRKHFSSDKIGAYALLELQLIDVTTGRVLSRIETPRKEFDTSFIWHNEKSDLSDSDQKFNEENLKKMTLEWLPLMSGVLVSPGQTKA